MIVDLVLLPRIWPAMAPTIAPPTTFCTSLLFGSLRTRSICASATDALTGYVRPPNVTERTANSITILSVEFSLRLRLVTSSDTVAPDGMDAPLEPVTPSATVAENVWPAV